MNRSISSSTVQMLKELDNEALASCLFAACDLALRAARGNMEVPPEDMTAEHLLRQLITDMPKRSE